MDERKRERMRIQENRDRGRMRVQDRDQDWMRVQDRDQNWMRVQEDRDQDWMRRQEARERRRAIQKRRRQNQLIRRGLLTALCFCMALFGIRQAVSGKAHAKEQNQNVELASYLEQEPGYRGAEGNGFFCQLAAMTLGQAEGAKGAPQEPEEIRILIDPGHGGKDPGTLWKDVYEKDINLAIAKKLVKILTDAGYRVLMTRDSDARVVLSERVKLAEEQQVDLFVSIHQNALEKDTVTEGFEIYSSSRPGSAELAELIRSGLRTATGAVDKGITKNSDLYVLDNTTMPACLVETGFLTCKEERERLLNEDYQQKVAQGIAEGILKFLGEEQQEQQFLESY